MEIESTMSYLSEKLKVSLENAELFVVMELVQAPSIGEITRSGFVDGWKSTRLVPFQYVYQHAPSTLTFHQRRCRHRSTGFSCEEPGIQTFHRHYTV